jgi:molecular chaperone GrpE (heat shock protein)
MTVQLQADQKNFLNAIETLKQYAEGATQDLLSKSDNISRALSLVSDLAVSNNEKLQKISDAGEDVQETVKIVKGLSPSSIHRR